MNNKTKPSYFLPNLYSTEDTYKPSSKLVVKIIISELCMQSCPCQHECKLIYCDNREENVTLNARYIYINYNHLISSEKLSHLFKSFK